MRGEDCRDQVGRHLEFALRKLIHVHRLASIGDDGDMQPRTEERHHPKSSRAVILSNRPRPPRRFPNRGPRRVRMTATVRQCCARSSRDAQHVYLLQRKIRKVKMLEFVRNFAFPIREYPGILRFDGIEGRGRQLRFSGPLHAQAREELVTCAATGIGCLGGLGRKRPALPMTGVVIYDVLKERPRMSYYLRTADVALSQVWWIDDTEARGSGLVMRS